MPLTSWTSARPWALAAQAARLPQRSGGPVLRRCRRKPSLAKTTRCLCTLCAGMPQKALGVYFMLEPLLLFARSGGVRRRAPGFSTRAELVLQACLTLRGRLFPFPRLSLAVGRFPEPHVGMQCNPNISIEGALRLSLFSFVDL